MKKIISISIILLLFLTGCGNNKENISENLENKYFKNFPEVLNIVNYLELDTKDIIILEEINNNDKNYLAFTYQSNMDNEKELNYLYALEDDGFDIDIYDGTITATIELQKDDITIKSIGFSEDIFNTDKYELSDDIVKYIDDLKGYNELFIIEK